MAIGFARLQHVSRSKGKNSCCKAAYNSRGIIHFEGHEFSPEKTYNFSHKEKCVFHEVLLPSHVDKSFKSPEILWNAAESAETRKNSQVAMELVLALPDDKCISIEDRIELTKIFIEKHFVDKGLAVQIDIHPPENTIHLSSESGEVKNYDHNWHAHILITTRRFTKDGKNLGEKARDLMADVKTVSDKKSFSELFVDGEHWGKIWALHQNHFFEENGLSLRVDPTGVIPQIHLGPVRMRGRAYDLIEENNLRVDLNLEQAKNPSQLVKAITQYKNVFTNDDITSILERFVDQKHHSEIMDSFWKQKEIVPLLDFEGKLTGKFSTKEILAEEKRCLDFADSIQKKEALRLESNFGQFSSDLSNEQKDAYSKIVNGKRLSCIGGYAGTGKSHLLVALKRTYEAEGYIVRAFGPDTATSKVLKEKGFSSSENLHRFLFCLKNQKREIKHGKELWVIDEASKLGNRPITQLLKFAKEYNVQLVFSGDQFQMGAVERGCMYKTFCERYGSADLLEIKRQKREKDKEISKQIATGKISQAIDEITRTGGIIWDDTRKDCIEKLIKKWAADREAFPDASFLITALSRAERKVLNEMVRLYRKEKGEISKEEFECRIGDRKIYLSVGDLIEFSKNDKTLAVTNGMCGVLVEASPERFVVSVKEGDKNRAITFNPTDYSSYQLGYATTYHPSQGKTVDRAYVLHSPRLNKESFYVGLTRHVQKAYLFVPKDNMHYLSYMKAKACGFNASYNKFLSNYNYFKSKSKEEYIAELKNQVSTADIKESTKSYQTAKENSISELKNSGSIVSKLKGFGLSAWNQISGMVTGRYFAKKADHEFYNPTIEKEEQATITEIPASSFNQEPYEDQELEIRIDKTIISNVIQANQSISHAQDINRANEVSLKEPLAKIDKWKSLSSDHQEVLQHYFDAKENAHSFYVMVKSESENEPKNSPHFDAWMQACRQRNEAAYRVARTLLKEDLQAILGKVGVDILWDKSHKHERDIERASAKSLNIDAALKENFESLLFKLFPEGPSRRERNSLRFGSKGSLVVKCSGEKTGLFFDHENQVGGGPLNLIQKTLNLTKSESKEWAKEFLGANHHSIPQTPVFKSPEKIDQWISSKPDPNFPAPCLKEISKGLNNRYKEEARHAYHNEKGELLFYVLRLSDNETSKKRIFQLSFGKEVGDESFRWSLRGYQIQKKPLYNLQEVVKDRGGHRFGC